MAQPAAAAVTTASCQQQAAATYFGVNIVDLDVRPDKKAKKGKGKIKRKYLRKFPAIRKDAEGNVIVDGISNKQHPCPIDWKEPTKIERIARSGKACFTAWPRLYFAEKCTRSCT